MSDHIAHLGICDDTFRLSLLHPKIGNTFQKLMTEERDIAHLGAVTRSADNWSADLIVWASGQLKKASGDPHGGDPLAGQKLAFVLGALTHRAADRLTKPITRAWGDGDDSGHGDANESKVFQDVFVWKEVYASGAGPSADPFTTTVLNVPQTEAAANAEMLFRVLLRRALISMHTIAPDKDNIQPWLTQFLNRLQTFPKSLTQYATLAAQWDQQKAQKYLIEKNFYCRDDAIIQTARAIQRGSTVTPNRVVEVVEATDKTSSRYARALAKAIEYLIAATELFEGKIDLNEGKRRFDIGVPELSLQD